jgi:hypothetical protein
MGIAALSLRGPPHPTKAPITLRRPITSSKPRPVGCHSPQAVHHGLSARLKPGGLSLRSERNAARTALRSEWDAARAAYVLFRINLPAGGYRCAHPTKAPITRRRPITSSKPRSPVQAGSGGSLPGSFSCMMVRGAENFLGYTGLVLFFSAQNKATSICKIA